MQSIKLRPIFKIISIKKEFIRAVSVTSTAVKEDSDLKSWREIPGPSSWPIIGQLHHYLPGGHLQYIDEPEGTMRLFERYGPIVRLDGLLNKPTMILLSDPESSAQVLRGENWLPFRPDFLSLLYYRKDSNKKRGLKIDVTGLIADQGELWKDFRSTVNPVMLQPKTIKLYSAVIDEVAQDMVARMKKNRDEKNMIHNFDLEMNLWALESVATVALGCRLNCFDPHLTADSPVLQLTQCLRELFFTIYDLDNKPNFWQYFSTPTFKKAMKLYERHENLTRHFLKKGIAELENKSNNENEKGVLQKLLEINEEVAYIMASDMIFAGVDSTAISVTAIIYLLAKNPEKQGKLREEIMSKCQKRPYLKACIKEAMRIFPPVSGNMRMTTKEYDILGYKVPKNMQIIFANRDMSLMEEFYPRPLEFIPERWTANKDDPLYHGNAHPFAHAAFGFGPRSCIGRRIAELEMETFIARLIENFSVEWLGPPPKIIHSTLNYFKGPFYFTF